MFERSEFGRRAASGEARRGPARRSRAGSRPAKGLFGSFLVLQKGTRARQRAKPLLIPRVPFALSAACDDARAREQGNIKINSFRAEARLTFVATKVSKIAFAGREPARLRRAGPLRFSDDGARCPNSLRSDMGSSPAPPSCDARLALRLEDQDPDPKQEQGQGQDLKRQQSHTRVRRARWRSGSIQRCGGPGSPGRALRPAAAAPPAPPASDATGTRAA